MTIQARLDAIGIAVADMAKALAFYRRLGLEVPASADGEPHVARGAEAVSPIRQHLRRAALPSDDDPVLVLVDGADRDAEADLDAGAFDGPEQDFVQLQAGQGAKCRHPVVAEQELVLHDQPSIGIEQPHPVIAEPGGEDFVEHAERVVDPKRIGRLAQADARNIEGRPPLDQHDFDAAPGEGCSGGQPADAAADHENTPNVAHLILRLRRGRGSGLCITPVHFDRQDL